MAKRLAGLLSLVVLIVVMSGVGYANLIPIIPLQVTFGPSTTGSIIFNNTGSPGASVAFGGVSGWAYLGGGVGTFSLSNATVALTSGSNSYYTLAANSETFTVNIGVDTLSGTLSLANIAAGNTVAPLFLGAFTTTSATSLFLNAGFPVGVTEDIDFTVYTGTNGQPPPKPTLDQVWTGAASSTSGYVSSGQIIPDTTVPEPGTIALMGTGLIAVAGLLRRRA